MVDIFKNVISAHLDSDAPIFLYWKGRVALFAILKAMGIKDGDEVILPAFTCVAVPNAIIYCGAKPVYVDIDPDTYNICVSKVEEKISSKTRAIICQNTFGLSSNLEKLAEITHSHHLYLIEDTTHGFGGTYHNLPNGTYADASFFSTQWNKPFSTGLGGFALIINPELVPKIEELELFKIQPSIIDIISLKIQLVIRKHLINDFTYWKSVKLYRWLNKFNLILGSSNGTEISSVRLPKRFFKGISNLQINEGISSIRKIGGINAIRKKNAHDYTEYLRKAKKTYVSENLFNDHIFLKYPLLVRNREEFLKLAQKNEIPLGEWFLSPIHPVLSNFETWFLNIDEFPIAKDMASKVVNLPTDIMDQKKVIDFIEKYSEFIL